MTQLACKGATEASSSWSRGERCENDGSRGRAGHRPTELTDRAKLVVDWLCLAWSLGAIWIPNGWATTRRAKGVESWPKKDRSVPKSWGKEGRSRKENEGGERGKRKERNKKKGKRKRKGVFRVCSSLKTRIYTLFEFLKQGFVFTQIGWCFRYFEITRLVQAFEFSSLN